MKAVYRIVAALSAALTIPALYFLNLIHYVVKLNVTEGYLDDNITTQQMITLITDHLKGSDRKPLGANVIAALQPLKPSAIVTVVFIALMLLMILAVLFCSALTNARKVNLIFAGVGLSAAIGAMASFNHMTSLIVNNTVGVGDILNAFMADSTSSLAGIASMLGLGGATELLGELVLLRLGSAFIAVVLIFGFIIVWTISFLLVDADPNAAENAKIKKLNKAKK